MTTATKTFETSMSIIKISLTRSVSDKVNYADGYNIVTGREAYESYEILFTLKASGKQTWAHGKRNDIIDYPGGRFNTMPAGAAARIGDGYVRQNVLDLILSAMDELDAEVAKTAEQIKIETTATEAKKHTFVDTEPIHGVNGYCRKCHSYCYGDCDANR